MTQADVDGLPTLARVVPWAAAVALPGKMTQAFGAFARVGMPILDMSARCPSTTPRCASSRAFKAE